LQDKFLLCLAVAALFHDIGKANEDFLAAVSTSGFLPQTLRHEHLSALILCLPEVRDWLSENQNLDIDIITAAVLSHHLKASRSATTTKGGQSYKWGEPKGKSSFRLYLNHPEVRETLNRIAKVAQLDINSIPQLAQGDWGVDPAWGKAIKNGRNWADDLAEKIEEDEECQLLLAAVKAGLIASDAVASGLVREDIKINDWIDNVLHIDAIESDEIDREIIYPRLGQILAKKEGKQFNLEQFRQDNTPERLEQLKEEMLHGFQKNLEFKSDRTLLLAGCGVGKTLAAWVWAQAQAKQHRVSKVIFLYPTRGTALEGFKDYVSWAPEADAALVTGTARYELEAMRENPDDEKSNKIYRTEADERLYALGFWSKRFFSATVDQFLSFMEHSYQSLCLIPALVDSLIIIDEVHSFDRSMFDNLISFLQHFDIPVLCMTATLPTSRREELVKAGLTVYPTPEEREKLEDLQVTEERERYRLHRLEKFDLAFAKAVNAYREGKRVLWVVNTVDRCIAISEKLAAHLDTDRVLTYHSRFKLADRQNAHKQTVAAFQAEKDKPPERAIAVTTQVCEMSLDLDADVLITELAPISSLVQRFGRANRHLYRDFADIYVYEAPKEKPYHKDDLDRAKEFLASFSGKGNMSQYALAEGLENFSKSERDADGAARFLDSGYFAIPGDFRDADEFTVPCILKKDLDTVKPFFDKGSKQKHKKEGYIINTPKNQIVTDESKPAWMPKYLSIAPSDKYNELRGFVSKQPEEVELG
jgi:CRISPR-associated endonuclease/helicase Cas3